MDEVRTALGEPSGTGGVMLPVLDDDRRQSWSYYYEHSELSPLDSRRIFLFVYFDQGIYDGYLWFSSLAPSSDQ